MNGHFSLNDIGMEIFDRVNYLRSKVIDLTKENEMLKRKISEDSVERRKAKEAQKKDD